MGLAGELINPGIGQHGAQGLSQVQTWWAFAAVLQQDGNVQFAGPFDVEVIRVQCLEVAQGGRGIGDDGWPQFRVSDFFEFLGRNKDRVAATVNRSASIGLTNSQFVSWVVKAPCTRTSGGPLPYLSKETRVP